MNNKLFKDLNLSNKPSRNGFDLSHNVKYSAKAGELLPITHFTAMVGDSFKMSVSHRTRTAQMIATPFTEIREYFDWFFVPYRLLWKMAPNVLAQDTQNPVIASSLTSNRQVSTQLPQIDVNEIFRSRADALESANPSANMSVLTKLATISTTYAPNPFGFNRMWGAVKLLNMLGYCYVTNEQALEFYLGTDTHFNAFFYRPYVSVFPILAYNKIYYDYFRNPAWEKNQPYNYNVDWISTEAIVSFADVMDSNAYWKSDTMFDLRYANYPKDIFYGLLPDSQFGEEAEAEGGASTEINHVPVWIGHDTQAFVTNEGKVANDNGHPVVTAEPTRLEVDVKYVADNLKTEISILELRKQKFLQRYREIVGSGAVDYQNIIKKVFGVDVPDDLADHSIYIGGYTSTVKINNTTNTNLTDSEPVIRSNGDVISQTNNFEFSTNEFGIVMCIYHAAPVIDYSLNAYHFDVLRTEVDDFANPVFDRLGFQGLPYYIFNNDFGADVNAREGGDYPDNPFIGYTSRYYDYKTSVDRVLGVFREFEDFKAWLSPVDTNYLQDYVFMEPQGDDSPLFNFKLNSSFFKVDPRILNSIFFKTVEVGSINEDQLYVSAHLEIHKVTNLDYLGMPM